MKLKYELDSKKISALKLSEGEAVRYCVPYDLAYDFDAKSEVSSFETKEGYFVVTNKRMIVLRDLEIASDYELKKCSKIKCESMVGCGIVTAVVDGEIQCVLRFSMRHIERIAYVAKGADCLAKGEDIEVTSSEYEKYCEKCHRALPGTRTCPYCGGRGIMFKKVWALCREFKWKFLLVSIFTLAMSFIAVLIPEIQKRFIDNVLRAEDAKLSSVYLFIAVMVTITAIRIVLDVIKYWWNVSLGGKISMSLRKRLYDKIQVLSLSFINKRKPGELMNRVASDTVKIRDFMEEVFNGMVYVLVTMIVAFIGMLLINFKLAIASSILLVSVFVITKFFWQHIRRIFNMQWMKDDKVRSGLQDVISGMRVVKAFGREQYESEKFSLLTSDFAAMQKKNETFWASFYPMLTFIMGMGTYIAVFFGGRDVINGSMTSGELVQFITYAGLLFGELGWMTHLPRSIMSLITSINRIYDVLDEEPDVVSSEKAVELDIRGDVEFDDISFGYNSYEPVLEHVSAKVNKGEMIGIVGASGTGKSTLINLIMRLYDVDAGTIKIDGVNIKDIEMSCLHSQIGVVLQETFLFSGTILNNIKFAKPDATMEEVINAAKAANAHDFICKMPDGYDTYVGEHGYKVSGGERQRIAIARAILTNPKLLILDEATSALDTESEYLIQQALERLTKGRTTFAIAHRLSTLKNASRLLVIDKHSVAEFGTHNELLEKKGIYYGLVKAQLEMAKV